LNKDLSFERSCFIAQKKGNENPGKKTDRVKGYEGRAKSILDAQGIDYYELVTQATSTIG